MYSGDEFYDDFVTSGPTEDDLAADEAAEFGDRCESGWTGDRCTFQLGHEGLHSNESYPRRARIGFSEAAVEMPDSGIESKL